MGHTRRQQQRRGVPAAPWPRSERPFPFEDPTPFDRAVLEQRQLGHPVSYLLGVGRRCRHKMPQAFVTSMLNVIDEKVVVPYSSTCWLSCPILVEAVDRLEREGWIEKLSARVAEDQELRRKVEALHGEIIEVRRQLLPEEWRERIEREPEFAHHRYVLFKTGLAGITRAEHVKCLHAHLGDFLCRGTNPIGEIVWQELQRRGVAVHGSAACWKRCMPTIPSEPAGPGSWRGGS